MEDTNQSNSGGAATATERVGTSDSVDADKKSSARRSEIFPSETEDRRAFEFSSPWLASGKDGSEPSDRRAILSDRRKQSRRKSASEGTLAQLRPQKDLWDKTAAVAPIISGAMIFVIGGFFTYTFNQQQLRLQEIQTIEKFIPHLMGNEQSKKAAILAISSLTNTELAAKFANIFASSGTVSALQKIYASGTDKERDIAGKAISDSVEQLASRDNKLAGIESGYKSAIASADTTTYTNKADLAFNLARLAQLYQINGQNELAEPLLTKSLQIRQSIYGEQNPIVADTLKALAELYQNEGKKGLSETYLKRARAIEAKLLNSVSGPAPDSVPADKPLAQSEDAPGAPEADKDKDPADKDKVDKDKVDKGDKDKDKNKDKDKEREKEKAFDKGSESESSEKEKQPSDTPASHQSSM